MTKTQSEILKRNGLMHAVFRRYKRKDTLTNSLKTLNPTFTYG